MYSLRKMARLFVCLLALLRSLIRVQQHCHSILWVSGLGQRSPTRRQNKPGGIRSNRQRKKISKRSSKDKLCAETVRTCWGVGQRGSSSWSGRRRGIDTVGGRDGFARCFHNDYKRPVHFAMSVASHPQLPPDSIDTSRFSLDDVLPALQTGRIFRMDNVLIFFLTLLLPFSPCY